jgi:hypothetical protein
MNGDVGSLSMPESTSLARKKLKTKKELDRRRRASGPLRLDSSSSGEEEEGEAREELRKRKSSSSSSGSERRSRKRRKSSVTWDVESFRESAVNQTMQVDAARLPIAVLIELSEWGKVTRLH